MRFAPAGIAGTVLAAAIAAGPAPAAADLLFRNTSFSISGNPGTGIAGFPEFDPSLGTLDKVAVNITGTFSTQILLLPGAAFLPTVDLGISRIGPHGFSFGSAATYTFPLVSNPVPPPPLPAVPTVTTISTEFTFDFTFTSLTDLAGFAVPTATATNASVVPPVDAAAQRDDFLPIPVGFGVMEQFLLQADNFVPDGGFTGGGLMMVTFDYTPTTTPPVPAPGAGLLFALGLFAAGAMRAWRTDHSSNAGKSRISPL